MNMPLARPFSFNAIYTPINNVHITFTGGTALSGYDVGAQKRLDAGIQTLVLFDGFVAGTFAGSGQVAAANSITNAVPQTLSRIVPNGVPLQTLGRPGVTDVFVTAADDVAGLSASQIANRLTIPPSPTGYNIITFSLDDITGGIASPINRLAPRFVGQGQTAERAREFVIPNMPIPRNSTITTITP